MRVLILGSDTPLGQSLVKLMTPLARHELVPLTRANCRWKSERQAKKAIVRAKSDTLVDLRIAAAAEGIDQLQEADLQRCHWVAKACQRGQVTYLYVSSSRVFSGQLDRPYTEEDFPDNETGPGAMMASGEQMVRDACEKHLILRLGPVFSFEGTNLITQMLSQLGEQDSALIMDNHLRGCPVAADDGARVVSALLDQLSTGVDTQGIYHYCSSDTATYYEFAEALLASASQFSTFSPVAVQEQAQPENATPLNRSLNCDKIRNTFAIKQATWRGAIAAIVKRYYETLETQE
ncbi:MAG: sugar nucleotide-binding protein [Pseudomonadota bacterium]